ncbi:ferritin-like domain-containing protein [Streptomyces sp. B6B3]|uniref:ferritin-like domain-containing protein n=1 Tax=Streptomyces sp. B6B3 TaxID=3153570 RepID=UPI00325CEB9D
MSLTHTTSRPDRAGRARGSRPLTEEPPASLEATQAALAAEHAAVYGYGVVGSLVDEKHAGRASEAHAAHRARRDALERTVRQLGAAPVAAAVAYQLPFPVADGATALRLAARLESRLAGAYADLVAATAGEERRSAASALREAAVRAVRWGGDGVPFPGLPEYADSGGDR